MPGMFLKAKLAQRFGARVATALVLAAPVVGLTLAAAALQNGAAARDLVGGQAGVQTGNQDETITSPPAPGEQGPLVADGAAPDLALIYTGGVVGYVEPCG